MISQNVLKFLYGVKVVTLCTTFVIAQPFSFALALDVTKTIAPTGSSPTWTYQHKEYVSNVGKTHVGVDIFGAETTKGGDPIYPFADGVVEDTCAGAYTVTGCSPDFGNAIMIKHPKIGRNGLDLYSICIHLQDLPTLSKGYPVKGGSTRIGKIGNTGASNGYYHAHCEIRYFPTWLFPEWGNIYCPGNCTSDSEISQNWEDPQNILLYNQRAASLRHPDGTLIRAEGDNTVYYLENGLKRGVPDEQTLLAMGRDPWRDVIIVSPEERDCYDVGPAINPANPPFGSWNGFPNGSLVFFLSLW